MRKFNDEDDHVLTLAAIARELRRERITDAAVAERLVGLNRIKQRLFYADWVKNEEKPAGPPAGFRLSINLYLGKDSQSLPC